MRAIELHELPKEIPIAKRSTSVETPLVSPILNVYGEIISHKKDKEFHVTWSEWKVKR
jgi:hypothetical protein